MNLELYYRLQASEVKAPDLRLVGSCLANHIGRENATTLEKLANRTGFSPEAVREKLYQLVEMEVLPIASLDRPFLMRGNEERWEIRNRLAKKEKEFSKMVWNLNRYPIPESVENEPEIQESLF